MYTYNRFCYGHQLELSPEINNSIYDLDLSFRHVTNKKVFCVDFPYHGGKSLGDVYSIICGIEICDDDFNPKYIDVVRSSKEEDYIEDYDLFITEYKKFLSDIMDSEDEVEIKKIISFFDNNRPKFYSIDTSS